MKGAALAVNADAIIGPLDIAPMLPPEQFTFALLHGFEESKVDASRQRIYQKAPDGNHESHTNDRQDPLNRGENRRNGTHIPWLSSQ